MTLKDAWVSSWQYFRCYRCKSLSPPQVGILMFTDWAPILADNCSYSIESEFVHSLFLTGKKQLASRFNLTNRYIDDVLSINDPKFEYYLRRMYLAELEIMDTKESITPYLDLLLSIRSGGQFHASVYDKQDDFNFHITNCPFRSSDIPSPPAYIVFIS